MGGEKGREGREGGEGREERGRTSDDFGHWRGVFGEWWEVCGRYLAVNEPDRYCSSRFGRRWKALEGSEMGGFKRTGRGPWTPILGCLERSETSKVLDFEACMLCDDQGTVLFTICD